MKMIIISTMISFNGNEKRLENEFICRLFVCFADLFLMLFHWWTHYNFVRFIIQSLFHSIVFFIFPTAFKLKPFVQFEIRYASWRWSPSFRVFSFYHIGSNIVSFPSKIIEFNWNVTKKMFSLIISSFFFQWRRSAKTNRFDKSFTFGCIFPLSMQSHFFFSF